MTTPRETRRLPKWIFVLGDIFLVGSTRKRETMSYQARPFGRKVIQCFFGGEFAAGSCETLLLHQPAGLKAARLLIVGVSRPTPAELRKAAGTAVRFEPGQTREISLVPYRGGRSVQGFRGTVMGALD